jgi:hypothetical protein
MTRRTTVALGSGVLLLAAAIAAEATYLWGTSAPTPSAARPVVVGDIDAQSAVDAAATDTAAIFTTSWRTYDQHLARVTALMTSPMADRYRKAAEPLKQRTVAARAVTDTKVTGSGVVSADAHKVRALVLLDQRTREDGGTPSFTARRALVTMVRSGGGWLVDNVQTR